MYKKILVIFSLLILLVLGGCFSNEVDYGDCRINVPTEELIEYVGDYVSPYYDVVNENNEVINQYEPTLKRVVDINGNEIDINNDKRTVEIIGAGLFKFIYGVQGNDKIPDAEVNIRFVFTPPTITVNELEIPFVYHKGLTYVIPEYSFGIDADESKSYFKIFHDDGNGNKIEVAYGNGVFVPEYDAGKYLLTYYAEGFVDNAQKKEFEVDAGIGPKEITENKIGYFDEEFGQYQFQSNNAKISYSSDVHYGDELGSTKFELTYADPRLATMSLCAKKDVTNYDYLQFYVYNANDFDLHFVMDVWYAWTALPKNEWTKIIIPIEDITSTYGSQYIKTLKDITGLLFKIGLAENPDENRVGTTLYFSSMSAYNYPTVEPVDGKIGYFDNEYGAYQFMPVNSEISYSIDVKYGEEEGSTKVVIGNGSNGIFGQLTKLIEKDVSGYDYVLLRVYNPNDFAIKFLFITWFGLTECAPNSWTEIKVSTLDFLDPELGANLDNGLSDLTWLTMAVGKAEDNSIPKGLTFYLSAMTAGVNLTPKDTVSGRIGYFDEEYGAFQLSPKNAEISYSTDVKYSNEYGSTKVVIGENNSMIFGELSSVTESDISGYDYLIYRVYNDNDYDIEVWFDWLPRTCCTAKQWTEIKVMISSFPKDTNNQVMATDIKGMKFKVAELPSGTSAPNGLTLYLSNLDAGFND